MKDDREDFKAEVQERIASYAKDEAFRELSHRWMDEAMQRKYVYNFNWLGVPIIQSPQDIIALQEIIWNVQPDLIIETGIARGGSVIFYASMLELLGNGSVVGIDIDVRPHNRDTIESHPLSTRVELIEGSSIDESIVSQVAEKARKSERVLVTLDANHTHEHVLRELELYSPFVTPQSYIVAFDTIVDSVSESVTENRPWGPGDSPATAVDTFLSQTDQFEVDTAIDNKLMTTAAPGGYLKKVK